MKKHEVPKNRKPSQGKVSLVGAGPGDPGLLTLKALKRLQEADLIIYDTLANPDHLRHAKDTALKLCVGKGFRHRLLSQAKINRLIIRAAKNGESVVRLKGGDPYLFGRGAEETLYLQHHRIPFEVIPGVTSATACAAYSGVPLTHREHNASVTFLTGHRAGDKNLDTIDWKKIISLNGTLVIYMGFYNLGKIVRKLVENGMSTQTPILVTQWGTLPWQKSCEGSLATIEGLVSQKKLGAPSIIIIGDVVTLRRELNWYEHLPLFGKVVVVTRTQDKNSALRECLLELGAHVIEFPLIEIQKATRFKTMDQAIQSIHNYNWLIFTSTYGVDSFFERLKKHHKKDARALSTVKIASVGPETTRALQHHGVSPNLEPKKYETQELVKEFKRRFGSLGGKRVLLPRTNLAPIFLEKSLEKLGASVKRVEAYRTKLPKRISAEAKAQLLRRKVDCVTFTSSSTVENFVKIFGLKNARKIAKKCVFASIGPVTSQCLRKYGLRMACQAQESTIAGLVEAIKKIKTKKKNG